MVDVVLEDMPGLDAIVMFRQVRPCLRFIVTAAANTKELEAAVRRQDVVYYHVKGFDGKVR